MIPFVDLSRTHGPLHNEFQDAFNHVLSEGRFIMGPDVQRLEQSIADSLRVKHAIGVSSGSDALLASLMALEVGPGDEVLVPTCTFFATAGAVVRLGAKPVFIDVDPHTLLMDTTQALNKKTPATKAVIPVHLYGQCVDIAAFQKSGITVIEDAAQAYGSTNAEGINAGAMGALGCFSFFPTKTLGGFGDGGLVTTNNDTLATKVRTIRVHGANPKFHHKMIGGNFRLDTLQAALLAVKLPHVDDWANQRIEIAERYVSALEQVPELTLLRREKGRHVFHQFVVRTTRRDALRTHLSDQGIGTAIYYPEPLHLQPCFADLGYTNGDLPNAEAACRECLALPCYPGLTTQEQEQVIGAIRHYFSA